MGIFQKRSPENPLAAKQPPSPVKPAQPVAPPAPPPQFLRDNEVRTQIAADAVINGKLSFTTPTRVEGKLTGELRCTELLVIGAKAVVEGWVKADEVQVEGLVRGEIGGARRVEIRSGGRFFGRLSARLLAVRDGGLVDGTCNVGPEVSLIEDRLQSDIDLERERREERRKPLFNRASRDPAPEAKDRPLSPTREVKDRPVPPLGREST
ncbi:MAG: bactofilin family protein [Candidatus Binatia bacterium]